MTNSATADRLANQLITAIRATENTYRRAPLTSWVTERLLPSYISSALSETPPNVPADVAAALQRLPAQWRREVAFTAQDAAMRRLWQKHRIVHTIDSTAWEAIGDAAPTDTIPPDVLQQLPYPNPLIIFPEPILLDHGERERQRIVGVFVMGDRPVVGEHVMFCSTSSPGVVGWNLTFAGLMETADGRPVMVPGEGIPDVMWTRTTLRLDEVVTLGELVETAIRRFAPYRDPELAVGDHTKDLPVLLARAVNAIVYLCARNADLRPLPARPVGQSSSKKRSRTAAAKPVKVVEVGYRVGAALRAWRRASSQGPAAPSGRTVAPHVRRSHFHTFKYGPGRTQTYVKWLPPIPVKMGTDDAETTTVIPVEAPR